MPENTLSRRTSFDRLSDSLRASTALSSPASVTLKNKFSAYVQTAMFVALGIVLFFAIVRIPRGVAQTLESWEAGLNKLSLRHAQAGVDYIFTFGPLSFLETWTIVPELFWQRYAGELCLKALSAIVLVLLAREMRSRFAGYTFLALSAVLLPIQVADTYVLPVVAVGLLLRHDSRWQLAGLMLAPPFFAVLALMKFTNFPIVVGTLGMLAALSWYEGRRSRAVAPMAFFVISFLLGWMMLGQRLENLPAFVRSMSEIVGGYSEAMVLAGSHTQLYLAIAILALLAASVATFGFANLVRPRPLAGLLILAVAAFKGWKHGFVRQDLQHVFCLFDSTALLAFAVPIIAHSEHRRALRHALLDSAVVLSLCGFYMATTAAPLLRPTPDVLAKRFQSQLHDVLFPSSVYADTLMEQEREHRALDLPKIRERVKDQTIDLISFEQGVLFANDLNWHPRPVFQSYAAYNPKLIEANAAHFRGNDAPRYVMLRSTPIDGRWPTTEDSGALLEMIDHFRPVLLEGVWLLLERVPQNDPRKPAGTVVLQKRIGFRETLSIPRVPGKFQTISIDIQPTLWGKLRTAVYRGTRLWVKVGTKSHGERDYRLIPGLARNEFLLDPLCEEVADFVALYGGDPVKQVTSLTLDNRGHYLDFQPEANVTIREYPLPSLHNSSEADAKKLSESLTRSRYSSE